VGKDVIRLCVQAEVLLWVASYSNQRTLPLKNIIFDLNMIVWLAKGVGENA
jgi:hypothetical protein